MTSTNETTSPAAAAADSTRGRPPVAAPEPWSFPVPVTQQLGNGVTVHSYHLPGQQVISAGLVWERQLSSIEPADREGVATIAVRCLDEGTRSHPGEAFAAQLESAGAGFGVEAGLSGMQATIDVPVGRFDRALGLFAEAALEPAFEATDVSRQVQLRLAEIEQAAANSAARAGHEFRRALLDPDCRASRMTGGEPGSVAAVKPSEVADFHASQLGPSRASLILAGDFTGIDPVSSAERAFGSWSAEKAASGTSSDPDELIGQLPAAVLVDRPGAVQADLRLGALATDRSDPRWADLTVAGHAMGGAFLSRLNSVLREKRGYTYGVRFGFTPLRRGGWYAVSGSFRTEVLADAVAEAREIMSAPGRPFTDAEISDAVRFQLGTAPLRFATADGVAGQAALQLLQGLPADYVTRSLRDLSQVTPESATTAYAGVVDPTTATLVVVGDAARLADPLREIGYSNLTVIS